MSKENRDRCWAKQKKAREQAQCRAEQGRTPLSGGDEEERVRALIGVVLQDMYHGRGPGFGVVLELTDETPSRQRTVNRVLHVELERAVGQVWERGWQPAELVRAVRRELGRSEESLITDVVVTENRRYAVASVDESWAAQVRGMSDVPGGSGGFAAGPCDSKRKGHVLAALRLLAFVNTMASLQMLLPPPGKPRRVSSGQGLVDPAKLTKVRGLLAKAEATEFPEEAEALSSRAQEMMARHRIDQAALSAKAGDFTDVGGRRLPVDAPYEQHKAVLLNVVAEANGCRSVWHNNLGLCTVMGFATDVNAVELLFTSLLVQVTKAMRRAGSTRDARGRSRTRSFRASFLSAFIERISERLHESAGSEERRVVDEYAKAGTDLLPILVSREKRVEEAMCEQFPEVGSAGLSRGHDVQGWWAGRAAADRALLKVGEQIET